VLQIQPLFMPFQKYIFIKGTKKLMIKNYLTKTKKRSLLQAFHFFVIPNEERNPMKIKKIRQGR